MNSQTLRELEERASDELQAYARIPRLSAEDVIRQQVANLKAQGKVLELSDEEERLLASFRRFKATCKAGAVFKWQTRPVDGVIPAPDRVLIETPEEVGMVR